MSTETSPELQDAAYARKVFRYMAMGVAVSQDNVERVRETLVNGADSIEGANLKGAIQVAKAMGMGLIPSEQNCINAEKEVEAFMDLVREKSAESMRSNMRERG